MAIGSRRGHLPALDSWFPKFEIRIHSPSSCSLCLELKSIRRGREGVRISRALLIHATFRAIKSRSFGRATGGGCARLRVRDDLVIFAKWQACCRCRRGIMRLNPSIGRTGCNCLSAVRKGFILEGVDALRNRKSGYNGPKFSCQSLRTGRRWWDTIDCDVPRQTIPLTFA
jgi:hypothetical protein